MVLTIRCHGCRRQVVYWAADLVKVVGPYHQAHMPPWPCSRCRTAEWLKVRWRVPSAEELAGELKVRRPVRQVVKWIWEDGPL